jgi:hypothetical protein
VIRAAAAANPPFTFQTDTGGTGNIDDCYLFQLDDVSITATPASEANSTEGTGLRVDGRDACSQPITRLTATRGRIRWNWTPRHGAGDFEKFGEGVDVRAMLAWNNGNDYIQFRTATNTNLFLRVVVGGVGANDNQDMSGIIAAGTTYAMECRYNSTQCELLINGVVRLTSVPVGGINFGANIPDTMYWGCDYAPGLDDQVDAVYAAP